jgi:catechol 2,3-dioxygenase-like lactoylglutathione lyase family enzyme
MTAKRSSRAGADTRLTAIEPQLFVTDLAASLAFFEQVLGLETLFAYGEPPFYASVGRDGLAINLRKVKALPLTPAFRKREPDALALTITVSDAKALFLACEAAGAPFHQRLRTEPWGARTFIVVDPDGNLLAFAGPGAEE